MIFESKTLLLDNELRSEILLTIAGELSRVSERYEVIAIGESFVSKRVITNLRDLESVRVHFVERLVPWWIRAVPLIAKPNTFVIEFFGGEDFVRVINTLDEFLSFKLHFIRRVNNRKSASSIAQKPNEMEFACIGTAEMCDVILGVDFDIAGGDEIFVELKKCKEASKLFSSLIASLSVFPGDSGPI